MKLERGRLRRQGVMLYLTAFSMIVVMIIVVMGGYLYRFYYRTIYENFVEANESDLKAIESRHENDMAIISDVVSQINLSTDCTEFLLDKQPLKSTKLEEQLYRYTAVSQFFGQVLYFYHGDQYLYNHQTSVRLDNFVRTGLVLGDTDAETFRTFLCGEDYRLKVLAEQTASGYIKMRYMNDTDKVTVYLKTVVPKRNAVMVFLVPEKYYDELFDTGDAEDGRSHYILYDGQIIVKRESDETAKLDSSVVSKILLGLTAGEEHDESSTDNESSNSETEKFSIFDELASGTTVSQKISVDGTSMLVSMKTGDSGLIYVSMQPMNVFGGQIRSGMWGIVFLLVLCSIPAAFGIMLLYHKLAGRIRRINVMLKKEDRPYDLETIETGIESLVRNNETLAKSNETLTKNNETLAKNNETLTKNNETHIPLKKSRFVGNLVRGVYRNEDEIRRDAAEAKIIIPKAASVLVIMIGDLGGDRGQNNEGKAEKEMLDLVRSYSAIDGYRIKLISKTRNVFVIFTSDRGQAEEMLVHFFHIGRSLCEELVMAVSDYHENLMEVPQAYLEADTAFDTRFLVDNSNMIRYQQASKVEHIEILPESFLRRLKNAIRACNSEEADEVIDEICGKLKSSNHSLLSFRVLYNDILHILITEWNDTHVDFSDIYNVFLLSQCLNVQQFSDILHEVCHSLIDARQSNKPADSREPDMATKAVAYMKEHYSSPELTMAALADELSISPVTMSVEFKNRMGVNPSDYLGIIRMEKAKELLKTTTLKVKDVSVAVGYEDEHVFMRRFKKYVGKTPGQYREEYTQES